MHTSRQVVAINLLTLQPLNLVQGMIESHQYQRIMQDLVHLYHTVASYSSAWWYDDDYHQNQDLNMISGATLAKSGLSGVGGGHLRMYSTESEKPMICLPPHTCRYYAKLCPVTQVGMVS